MPASDPLARASAPGPLGGSGRVVAFSASPAPAPNPAPARCAGIAAPDLLLDISRLLSRMLHAAPTGVDRVEMAFARELLRTRPERPTFVGVHPGGLRGRLPRRAAEDFLHETQARWSGEHPRAPLKRGLRRAALACVRLVPGGRPPAAALARAYLHLSPSGLDRPGGLRRALQAEGARYVPLVHDLIPLRHPEYARPGGAARFARRLDVMTAAAAGVACNSAATAAALKDRLDEAGRSLPIRVVSLGADAPRALARPTSTPLADARPYFVMLGTIEPRKNHLMLLHVWRELVRRRGRAGAPRLMIVGRRGWENEMVLDLLERCADLRGVVTERGRLPDGDVRDLLAGARALLMPSFAEGFGLPVIEALAVGAPVVASDLPALREAGGHAPEYLDPLDGPAWLRAVEDYARPDCARRNAQRLRMRAWRARPWADAVEEMVAFAGEICQ